MPPLSGTRASVDLMTKKVVLMLGAKPGLTLTYDPGDRSMIGDPETILQHQYVPGVLCHAIIALAEMLENEDVLEVQINAPKRN